MRVLMLAAIGYASALLTAHYLLPEIWLMYFALGSFVLAFSALLFRGKARARLLILLLSAALGFGWHYGHSALFIRPAEALIDTTQNVEAQVVDYPSRNVDYSTVMLKLKGEGLPSAKVLVTDYDGGFAELEAGDIISIDLKFRSARQRYNEEDDYYLSSGVFLRANLDGEYSLISRPAFKILFWPKMLANTLKAHILELFPEDVAPLMKALLTGDKRELYDDDALYVSLKLAGLSHIIAVSGMHVSFIIALIGLGTGRRRITAFLGIPLVWFFAAMMGFGAAVTRASLMISLMLLAPILRRENDPPTSLSAALLILLVINPQSVGSLSLQLSFAAMAGIMLVSPRIYRSMLGTLPGVNGILGRLVRAIIGVISSSVGAIVFTTPLVALNFGYVPLYSILTNLLCIWAMSAAFMLAYPICIIGAVYFPLGEFLALVLAGLPRYTIFVVKHISRLPNAALYTYNNLISWWIIFVYAVIIIPWLFRGDKPYRPIIPICCCLVTLPIVTYLSAQLLSDSPSLTAIDVGQGQCIVAMSSKGTAVIDCGGGMSAVNAGDAAAEFILSSGRRKVDLLVLTHLHEDHANGVLRLMSYLDVERIALGADYEASELGDSILERCYYNGTEVFYIDENTNMQIDELSLDLFAPIGSSDLNESGLIVLGDYGEFEFLITGDAGAATERQLISFYQLGDIDLLVAGHHGSKNSTSESLLDSLTPGMAFISVGNNSYGHPSMEVLDRLTSRSIPVYRTDEMGNITIMVGNQ